MLRSLRLRPAGRCWVGLPSGIDALGIGVLPINMRRLLLVPSALREWAGRQPGAKDFLDVPALVRRPLRRLPCWPG